MSRIVDFELNGQSITDRTTVWSRFMPSIAATIEGAFSQTFALADYWKMNIDGYDNESGNGYYPIWRISFTGMHKHACISINIYGSDWDNMKREITETARGELCAALANNANEPGVVRIILDYFEFEV